MVYDVTRRDTIQSIPAWAADAVKYAGTSAKLFLLADKVDLCSERIVDIDEGCTFGTELGAGPSCRR
jgi:GTPase SAR1 family protein